MPNSKTHKTIGAIAGLASLHFLPPPSPGQGLATYLGRAAGGAVGGLLPDRWEPATSPRHRDRRHSLMAGGVASGIIGTSRTIEAWLLNKSAEMHQAARGQRDVALKFLQQVWAWVVEFLGGLAVGIVVGYVSHLAADMSTPAGIPIFRARRDCLLEWCWDHRRATFPVHELRPRRIRRTT